jgi:cytochrome c
MSRKSLRAALAGLVLGWSTTLVFQLGTAKDGRAMLDRAIAALKSNEHAALSQFNDQNNRQFHDRDLYVFCFDMSDGKARHIQPPFSLVLMFAP